MARNTKIRINAHSIYLGMEAAAVSYRENTYTCAQHFRTSSIAQEDRVSEIVGGKFCTIFKAIACRPWVRSSCLRVLSDLTS